MLISLRLLLTQQKKNEMGMQERFAYLIDNHPSYRIFYLT